MYTNCPLCSKLLKHFNEDYSHILLACQNCSDYSLAYFKASQIFEERWHCYEYFIHTIFKPSSNELVCSLYKESDLELYLLITEFNFRIEPSNNLDEIDSISLFL